MNSSSVTSAAEGERAPPSPPSKIPGRRWGGRLFLFTCLLALLALVGLFLVAFQLHREQAAWEKEIEIRRNELTDLKKQTEEARSDISKIDDRRREAINLKRELRDLRRERDELNSELAIRKK